MEIRPIDANAALDGIEELKKSPWYTQCISNTERLIKKEAVEIVEDLCIRKEPTLDYAHARHGWWIPHADHATCSVCFCDCWADSVMGYDYCPNCGAKMDGGKYHV